MGELIVIALASIAAFGLHQSSWYRKNVEHRFGLDEE